MRLLEVQLSLVVASEFGQSRRQAGMSDMRDRTFDVSVIALTDTQTLSQREVIGLNPASFFADNPHAP
jgi:hypothetical protein